MRRRGLAGENHTGTTVAIRRRVMNLHKRNETSPLWLPVMFWL